MIRTAKNSRRAIAQLLILLSVCMGLGLGLRFAGTSSKAGAYAEDAKTPVSVEKVAACVLGDADAAQYGHFVELIFQFDCPAYDLISNLNDVNNYVDATTRNPFLNNILLNGKKIGEISDRVSVHSKASPWFPRAKDGATGKLDAGLDSSKLLLYIGFGADALKMWKDETNVLTLLETFPVDGAWSKTVAPNPNLALDKSYNYRLKFMTRDDGSAGDGGNDYLVEETDSADYVSQSFDLFPEEPGDDDLYVVRDTVQTSALATPEEPGYAFAALAVNTGEYPGGCVQLDRAEGVDATQGVTLFNRMALEFWVYTNKPKEEFSTLTSGVELSAANSLYHESEYKWAGSPAGGNPFVYNSANFRSGVWNRVILRLADANIRGANTDNTLYDVKHFRIYSDNQRSDDRLIYISDVRMVVTSCNFSGVVETRKAMPVLRGEIGNTYKGKTVQLPEASTTLLAGGDEGLAAPVFVSSDPSVLSIEGNTAKALGGTAQGTEVTVTATIPEGVHTSGYSKQYKIKVFDSAKQQSPVVCPADAKITYGDGGSNQYVLTGFSGGSGTDELQFEIDPSSTGAGTIAGGKLTISKCGDFVVNVTKPAYDEYAEASATFRLTVDKRKITVKIDDANINVGDLQPIYTVKLVSGSLLAGERADRIADYQFSCTGELSQKGAHTISATAVSDNYEITVQNGTLTVSGEEKAGCGAVGTGGPGMMIAGMGAAALLGLALLGFKRKKSND